MTGQGQEPITPERLAGIRKRDAQQTIFRSAGDRHDLLAEVARLTRELADRDTKIAAARHFAARSATGAYARGNSEERRRWLDLVIVMERVSDPEADR